MKVQITKQVAALLITLGAQQVMALPPRPPEGPGGGGGGVIDPGDSRRISGAVQFIGCRPALNDVSVKLMPGNRVVHGNSTSRGVNGMTTIGYDFSGVQNGSYTVSTTVPASCPGGQLQASSASVQVPGNANFLVRTPLTETVVELRATVDLLNIALGAMEMKLHNYTTNTSYLKILGQSVPLPLEARRMDLDCGILCPDLGDAIFYVNDTKLSDAQMSLVSTNRLKLDLIFEDQGREIKGLHNHLGDDFVPDFDLSNMKIESNSILNVRDDGRLDLVFSNVKFSAGVHSTGGCSLAGLDICDFFFGTDGKIKKGIQDGANTALNSSLVKAKIATGLGDFLRLKGITGLVKYYRIDGTRLFIYHH